MTRAQVLTSVTAALLLLSGREARAETWKRADIYLLEWRVETYVQVSPESLRHSADKRNTSFRAVTISDLHRIGQVVRTLDLSALRPSDGRSEDARLLVDLFSTSDRRITYYASRFAMATLDNSRKHRIDERFREYFRAITK